MPADEQRDPIAPAAGSGRVGADGRARRRPVAGVALGVFVAAVSVLLVWFSSGDHPLYTPDEARYGSVSRTMLDTGDWLVPQIQGKAHLTKPPLTYWGEAAAMKLLGPTELAVRLPSLLATSLAALMLLGITTKMAGARAGVAATAIFSVMPLVFGVGRTAVTDPVLNLFWLAALISGLLLAEEKQRRWLVAMWLALALGLFTKGPVALTPLGVVILWLALGKRWGDIGRLWIPVGLPAALIPLGLWVIAVYRLHPEAFSIWRHEILDRAGTTGDHPQPIWYYLPVFLAGLLPATTMLTLPGVNVRWKEAWSGARSSTPVALWALAILWPLVMFSLIRGKLATYLLPTAAPVALLAGLMLEQWMSRKADRPAPGRRWPDVVVTHTVVTALAAVGAVGAAIALNKSLLGAAGTLLLIPITSEIAWLFWKRRPDRRAALLALMWLGWVISYGSLAIFENHFRTTTDPRQLIATVRSIANDAGLGLSRVGFYGFYDPSFGFYTDRRYLSAGDAEQLDQLADESEGKGLILLADRKTWVRLQESAPSVAARFTVEKETQRWVHRKMLILSLKAPAPPTGGEHEPG